MAADWVLQTCDLNGVPTGDITTHATKRRMSYRLNRPMQLLFDVKSDAPGVVTQLKPGRVIKGWRREGGLRVLRFAGYIWQVSDEGDEDDYHTQVVCYGPFQRLAMRLCRLVTTNVVPADGKVPFVAEEAEAIMRGLIDRSNLGGGVTGVRTASTGPTGHTRTIEYEWRDVASVILELCEGTGINWYELPEDRTDGYLAEFKMQGALTTVANTQLSWGKPLHNVRTIERVDDMQALANDLRVLGSAASGAARPIAARTDATSIATYGRYEAIDSRTDLSAQAFIDPLADLEIALRRNPRTLVKSVPQPDTSTPNSVAPWDDMNLGWLINVTAEAKLRGGLSGQQRVWGWDLSLDEHGTERVEAIYTGSDA